MTEHDLKAEQAPETEAASAAAEPEAPETDSRDAVIAALTEERDRLLYQLAEAQNIVRRIKSQADSDRKFASQKLASSLLPVLDGFERTMAAVAKGASMESLSDGVRVMDKVMRKALENEGVSRVVSLGAGFDPEVHEALDTVESEELDEDTVVDEIEAGYMMHDRVIRHAKVRVSRKP
jgi:molecular chaperone GrpE